MSRFGWSNYTTVFGPSAASSNYTSGAALTVDYASISFSWITRTTDASRLTVEISNDDGFAAAIDSTSWSLATVITAQGQYTLDPGPKWTRFRRHSMESLATLSFGGWVG